MLERVIQNIFSENGFIESESLNNDFFETVNFRFRKNENRIEYFIIASISHNNFLGITQDNFSELYKAIKNIKTDPEVDKNTSLIICVSIDKKADLLAVERKELTCEENPFFFKKYVLTYDETIAEKVFSKVLKEEKKNIVSYIEKIIYDPMKFTQFKSNTTNHEEFLLLSKIIMKVPIIPIKIPNINSISSLSKMIDENITNKKLTRAQKLVNFLSNNKDCEINLVIENWKGLNNNEQLQN